MAAVLADAPHGLGDPHGVAAEKLVVFRCAQVAGHTKLHDEIIHDLLSPSFIQQAIFQIPLKVNIQKSRNTPQAHSSPVLLLDRSQICKIQPLHSLLRIFGRLGDIKSIHGGHLLQILQSLDLIGKLLAQPDGLMQHSLTAHGQLILLFLFNEPVHTIQGYPTIIPNNAATAVSVWQTGDNTTMPRSANLGRIGRKHAVVMSLMKLELFIQFRGNLIAISGASLPHHPHTSKGIAGPFQRLIRLQAND